MTYAPQLFSQQSCNILNASQVCSYLYETEASPINITSRYHYIYGETGAVALHIANETTGVNSMYYIHTDHLGSYCAITDSAQKVLQQRNWFDPWGNFTHSFSSSGKGLQPNDSIQAISRPALNFTLTPRGFTGHEHYPEFNIINMNGRLYDPVIGRFFSPDNFVQIPEFSQSFNRYSYCLNNPLKYVDPSGELIIDVDDWYLNLENGRVEYRDGNKNRFHEGLIHLANDRATVSDIANALTEKKYNFIKDASVEGGFWVDTEKQYKGWAMMQIFNPEVVGMILSMGMPEINNVATRGTHALTNTYRNTTTLLKEVQVTAKEGTQGLRSFTSSNFRSNLGKLTGHTPANSHAHHVFPQRYAPDFLKAKINIHDPKFGAWWEASSHLKNAKAYNAVWEEFLMKKPTQPQILNKGREMMQLYDIPVGY